MPSIELTVNGEAVVVDDDTATLLDVLRGQVGATSVKDGCSPQGQCGCCTVLVDGQPRVSCVTPVRRVRGRSVTTVEGLGNPEAMHVVQQAFVDNDAMQCGFCTPGFVMSCAYAVKKHGKGLTDEQVREACAGNLCRCGTYPHVIKAALAAAKKGS